MEKLRIIKQRLDAPPRPSEALLIADDLRAPLAASAVRADVVALSVTGCLGPKQVVAGLAELRGKLPGHVQLPVGGSAPVLHRRPLDGVRAFADMSNVAAAVVSAKQAAHP